MISVYAALVLVGFGVLDALVCVVVGTILHMRWLDRKLIKQASRPTQQLPKVTV